jgi:hypothetical protein
MQRAPSFFLAAAILLAACNGAEVAGGSPNDAMAIADDFLAALKAHDTDAAWSLVYPGNRGARFNDDRTAFDALVRRIDLSGVSWEVVSADVHDGHYHVSVRLDPLAVDEALGVFLHVARGDGPGAAAMQIDIEPLGGSRGVLGG